MILKCKLEYVFLFYLSAIFSANLFAETGQVVTFHRIAAVGDPMPGTSLQIKMIQDVSTSKGNVVFLAVGKGMHSGIYAFINKDLLKIVETGDAVPGGGKFTQFVFPAIFGGEVVFRGISKTGDGIRHDGIYLYKDGKISVIADDHMTFPDSDVKYRMFFKAAVYSGEVVFRAAGGGLSGIFKFSKGSIQKIADKTVSIPKSTEVFAGAMEPTISKGVVAFKGYQHTIDGIFLHDESGIESAADTLTKVPGRDAKFEEFAVPSNDGKTTAFWSRYGNRHNGIYKCSKGKISLVADDETLVPGKDAHFLVFRSTPSVSKDKVLFMAKDSEGVVGIYLHTKGELHKIIDSEDSLDGKRLTEKNSFERLRARSYDDDHVVFETKFSDNTKAIYLADTPW